MLKSTKLLSEIKRKRYEKIPYEERSAGLVSEFKMRHGCDLESLVKIDGGERVFTGVRSKW